MYRRASIGAGSMSSDNSFAWIFQANPKRFNVGAFAASAPAECEWLVSRYRNEIQPGQRVFLWCAAGDEDLPSGVFAEAVTLSAVREVADDSHASLWADPTDKDQRKPRVRVRIVRFANKRQVIKRDWWKGDPALSDHLIMTMPNHTTFRIEGAAFHRLDRLWESTGSVWSYEEAVGGLFAFLETLNGPVSKRPGHVVAEVALTVGRPITGIYNKVMNFRSLDPADPRKGFDGASDQDEAVWAKFYKPGIGLDADAIRAEYAKIRRHYSAEVLSGAPLVAAVSSRSLARELFLREFDWLSAEIERVSGTPLRSFNEGLPADWEAYKPRVRSEALSRLKLAAWSEHLIGSGTILEQAIAAIEISGPGDLKNNLVGWQNQYGHASRSHKALLDAREKPNGFADVERLLFDFFISDLPEASAFERFNAAGIKSYDLTAYLFFLKDMDRYMPIRPMTFDPVLERLGFHFSTTGKCSADNYSRFNDALREVQLALTETAGLNDIRLIDAHSFCWLLGTITRADRPKSAPKTATTSAAVYDARKRSIYMMAMNALAAAKAGNGQVVERIMKNKEVRMSQMALEAYIATLIEKQEGRCALTGLPLQYHKEHDDDQLLASLDRIDSNGHYEVGNLQVVCRFVNSWKSDTACDEFLRLLSLVRGT